eukprot:GHVL01034983.1.p1 GENE.GHVL01034983.1~~GHVL01034983.1.p1  ORF type:complete len:194 (+),score=22.39 GHVL01034983.1:60-641(+)
MWSCVRRGFCTAASGASAESESILGKIKRSVKKVVVPQMSKSQLNQIEGNIGMFKLHYGKPEFHNVMRNRFDRIIDPVDKFRIFIASSKNNVHITVQNRSRHCRDIFRSYAGNVGIRKKSRKENKTAYRIGLNIARKCRRLGIVSADVAYRRSMKLPYILQAFDMEKLKIGAIINTARMPKGKPFLAKKRRRV